MPEFDHNKTAYPLRGMHEKVKCVQCHVKPVFTNVGKNCADCHADIHRRQMGPNCEQCHTVQGWDIAVQQVKDHQNRFPLFGAHAAVPCEECHKQAASGQFLGLSTRCDSCHLKDWQNTTNPPHASAGTAFDSAKCQACHKFDSWLGATFSGDHAAAPINFALDGAHAALPCASCHVGNNYHLSIQHDDCGNSQCHLNTYQQTNNPPHAKSPQGFPIANCSKCHNTTAWAPATGFDHSSTGFLLTNGHAGVPCASCHTNNNYNLTIQPNDCGNSQCHLNKWQTTNNPVHSTSGAAFGAANCANCHTTKGWDAASFDHSVTGWPLTGAHSTTACALCHVNNNFTLTTANTDCYGCHQDKWNSTQNMGGSVPNHVVRSFPPQLCSQCHNTTDWAQSTFDHSITGFPLQNLHKNVADGGKVTGCISCHLSNNYGLTIAPTDCGNAMCHVTTWQQTNNPVHSTSGPAFAIGNCANCHTTLGWGGANFNHSTTGFALIGTHATTPCAQCHVNNNYTLTSANADCMSCHQTAWNSTQTLGGNVPNHVASNFPVSAAACSACHTITVWADGKFDHSTTGFPLTNSHQFAPAGKVTGCQQCHIGGNYTLNIQPTDCGNSQCHLTTWQQTNNPTHSTAGAPFAAANCSTCHNTISWSTATFDHSATGWPLTGVHTTTPCANCHVNNNYTFTSANTDCYGCHQDKYSATATMGGAVPNHVAAGFPTSQCSSCHTTTNWTSTWNHTSTGFPLQNLHQFAPAGKVVACTDCHVGNNYSLQIAPTACGTAGCHLTTWQQTNNPVHSTAGPAFALANCSNCHTTAGWGTANFDHSVTGWPLTGTHLTTPCANCHVNNNYTLTSANTDCYGCHQDKYNATATMGGAVPNHVAAGFPTSQCSSCHTTTNWTSTWNHTSTGFPLQNLHQFAPAGKVVACTDCHVGNNYSLQIAPTACGTAGCHLTTWQQTNNPVHSTAGPAFALANCSNCHTTAGWGTANFDHSVTGWPLTGTHLTTPCANCHVNNNYTLTSANTDCYGCHQAKWLSTQTMGGAVPNHVAANFPTSLCSTCHNTTAWNPGTFDHSTTGWALTGAHQMPPAAGSKVTACTDCHVSNNYSLTSANTACYGCHQAAWLSTQTLGGSVPNHIAAGYPTTCDTCHTTTTWLGATFNHTYFAIPHHGSVCNDCHQVSANYASFTCINCHTQTAHQKTQTDNTHNGVGGYTYGPTTCYNCHKGGG